MAQTADRKKEYQAGWRANHGAAWREKNKDKLRAYRLKFEARNPDYKNEHYMKNKDGILVKAKEYYRTRQQSPDRKYAMYKAQAKSRGIIFSLSFEQFMEFWQKPCYYSGDAIETIGLDRVVNSVGYVLGNIVPCCKACNKMKLTMTQDEFVGICSRVAARHGDNNDVQ